MGSHVPAPAESADMGRGKRCRRAVLFRAGVPQPLTPNCRRMSERRPCIAHLHDGRN